MSTPHSKWCSQDLDPNLLGLEPSFLTTHLSCSPSELVTTLVDVHK